MDTATQIPQPAPEAEEIYRRWLEYLNDEFNRHHAAARRAEIVREQLYQLYLGKPHGGGLPAVTLTSELPATVLELSLDPDNVTLAAESYPEIDRERFAERKPLIWFWKMFDRSAVGLNLWLGWRFRAMLARHIFAEAGRGIRLSEGIELTYGYNLSIGDGVGIRQGALLNDRGGISIGKGAVIGSFARVFSHVHDPESYDKVRLTSTSIGEGARVASHAIVLAGGHVGAGEVVGAFPSGKM